jgi:hypothetical protein
VHKCADVIAGAVMEAHELSDFVEALAEAERLITKSAAAVQRAKSRAHEDIYEHVDVISKRLSELRVHAEWLRLVALGDIDPAVSPEMQARQQADRRVAIDRRVAGMRKQLLSRAENLKKSA